MKDNQRQALRLAYTAGLMDGEGSFYIAKRCTENFMKQTGRISPYYMVGIRIGMTDLECLKFIKETFGFGKLYNEGVRKDRPHYKIMYRLSIHAKNQAIYVLNLLLPFLIAKKRQAELCLRFCLDASSSYQLKETYDGLSDEVLQRREVYYQECKKLNAVGAAATTNRANTCKGEVIV